MSLAGPRIMRRCILFLAICLLGLVTAQSSSNSASTTPVSTSASQSLSVSLSLTTSSVTITTTTRSGNQVSSIATVVPTTFNVTSTITPTATSSQTSSSSSATTSASASASATPIVLDTKLDPAFGVLGGILIITGLPSAFWGHKNRWTSFFLIGYYTLSLVCAVLIIKFGVLPSVNPPSKTLRGMFVLATSIAGIAGGGIAIFFWKMARYGIGFWGGFAFGLWIQCFHDGGLIKAIGLRWILYIGCSVIGFVLCTIPKIHYHILLVSTAFVGSSALMLGVDCFTTAGLKEFYMWNLGFRSLFPKFTNNSIEFPVSQTMQIELGIIGAVSLMGIAVQLRILKILQKKLHEIQEDQKKRDEEAELQATERFSSVMKDRDQWEKEHPTLNMHGRQESNYSSMPLMKDRDGSMSPGTPSPDLRRSSEYTHVGGDGRSRHASGVSEFFAAPTPDEDLKRATRNLQSPGALPTLDLGLGIKDDVPRSFIVPDMKATTSRKDLTPEELEELKRKEQLLAEIQTIRRSIDALKSESPTLSSSDPNSRHPSDATATLLPLPVSPAHLRPPREHDPRARVHSMEMSALATSPLLGESISRPSSTPLRDNDWDAYVHDRKLYQPPAGISAPIATTASPRMHIPQAVTDAIAERRRRESVLSGDLLRDKDSSSDDVPVATLAHQAKAHRRTSTGATNVPVNILPPRKLSSPIVAPTPQRPGGAPRTRTFEELNERHREKMRDLQAPLTQAERENAELEAAKERWEKAKAAERDAVTRRQAEKAAYLDKKKRAEEDEQRTGRKLRPSPGEPQSRSLSADKLAVLGGSSSKRLSTMKVEDWQKYQQQDASAAEMGVRTDRHGAPHAGSSHRRESRSAGVPFPDTIKPRGSNDRHRHEPVN